VHAAGRARRKAVPAPPALDTAGTPENDEADFPGDTSRRMTEAERAALPKPSKTLVIRHKPDGDTLRNISEAYLDPVTKAAMMSDRLLQPEGGLDLMASIRALQASVAEVQGGDMRQADAMLVAQATTLDSLFMLLMHKSLTNSTAGYLNASEAYMRLALKAQSQARTTWESVSKIKNPVGGATFIKQANMANGPQQVNNGVSDSTTPASAPAPAREIEFQRNELVGECNVVDSRAKAAAVGTDGGGDS
jgi:hypothetical protein